MSIRQHNALAILFLLATCIWGAFIWHWSSLPGSASPLRSDISPAYYDQIAHFCVFGLLAVFVWGVLKLTSGYPSPSTFTMCFTYGVIDEIHQTMAGHGRFFSVSDLLFDGLGILTAIVILAIAAEVWKRYATKA